MHLSRVQLRNVRCFERLDIRLGGGPHPPGWTVIVGDNATGKSTLLRSIAMGLCDEASAAGLLKESDEGYIRRGAAKAQIKLSLYDPAAPSKQYQITTEVLREVKRREVFVDRVRQRTIPSGPRFPWEELFVSAYGAGRGVTGTGDVSSYSALDAVYNMFNYGEGLQNPELVIRRLAATKGGQTVWTRQILKALCAVTRARNIRLTTAGLRVDGPWGDGMPLRDLADGYKSSVLWVTDLIGWALAFKPHLKTTQAIRGIVILDEMEQHLHARWQRTLVGDLRSLFPNLQFVAATHSPLIGSSIGARIANDAADYLYVLESTHQNQVQASPHEFMRGWRMDQVLASRAFRYQIQADPEYRELLELGSRLAAKKNRNQDEEQEYNRLRALLRDSIFESTSPIEREVEQEATQRLRDTTRQLERELFPEDDP